MPDELARLAASLTGSAAILIVAILIRVRKPARLVKGVDGARVRDIEVLGQFVSLIMSIMGTLLAAHGALVLALHDDKASRNIAAMVFFVLMAMLILAHSSAGSVTTTSRANLIDDKHGR